MVDNFSRILSINTPKNVSIFLWGARQTGKSSYLKKYFKQAIYYDLLKNSELIRLTKSPDLLREEILAHISQHTSSQPITIIIDEIQKVPELLNEVHWLIENANCQFILCGSSARKLKTQTTNLLGGRAWQYNFYPLVYPEIPEFDLLRALQHGLIPNHYLAEKEYISEYTRAYVDVYLTDEIRNEGLVRNLQGFARFLEVAGMCNTEMINFANIARDCGVNRLTAQGYFQILLDTLVGYFIYPLEKKIRRDIVTATPKFYFFDVGIANFLAQQNVSSLKGSIAGKSFENYIAMELIAYQNISRKKYKIHYWRTRSGLEVDFILGNSEVAIEVKISKTVHQQDIKGLIAFCEENPSTKALVVSQDEKPRLLKATEEIEILILPWRNFLEQLWAGELI